MAPTDKAQLHCFLETWAAVEMLAKRASSAAVAKRFVVNVLGVEELMLKNNVQRPLCFGTTELETDEDLDMIQDDHPELAKLQRRGHLRTVR